MSDRRVAILGGGLYRPGRVRYDNAEEGVAMAYKNMLDDFPKLDPREIEFVQSSYFSDHLNQQLCMAWIVQDYIGLHRKGGFRVEAGGSTPLDRPHLLAPGRPEPQGRQRHRPLLADRSLPPDQRREYP